MHLSLDKISCEGIQANISTKGMAVVQEQGITTHRGPDSL